MEGSLGRVVGGGEGVGGVVLLSMTAAFVLDDYNVCSGCGPTARIPRKLCKTASALISTASATGLKGLS